MTQILDLGLIPYADYLVLSQAFAEARAGGGIGDWLLFAVHPPILTLGLQSEPAEILWDDAQLDGAGIKQVQIDRGGHTTYHGPDQQMLYPICALELGELHDFVRSLQDIVVLAVAAMGVQAFRRDGFPGVWTDKGKLASLGLSVKQRVTRHGMALNCDPAISGGFEAIIPCGLKDVTMTHLTEATGFPISRFAIKGTLATAWELVRGERTEMGDLVTLPDTLRALLPDPIVQPTASTTPAPLPENIDWDCAASSEAACDIAFSPVSREEVPRG